ncbi:MAG: hypothetical protein KF819_01625 [Labilithrix sp.]|nr:hypothetical protein [Labilithrix sp.]
MDGSVALDVREEKPPLWAIVAPALYLLACALCIRAVLMDRSIDVGIPGLFVAVGLAPAFAVPAVFSSRRARLEATSEGLLVDGALMKFDEIRVERVDRGGARIRVETRTGGARTFVAPAYKDAQRLAAMLPPVSAPAGALAA